MADKEPLIKKDEQDYSDGKEELSGEIVKPDEEREYTDCIFIFLFGAFFIGSLVIVAVAWKNINWELADDMKKYCLYGDSEVDTKVTFDFHLFQATADKNDFYTFSDSGSWYALVGLVCLYMGFFWLSILSCCVAVIIYIAVYFIPISMIAFGGASAYYFHTQTIYLVGGVLLAIGGFAGIYLVRCILQEQIEATIDLFENASDYMEDSPMMFACSLGNILFKFIMLVVYLGFLGLGLASTEVEQGCHFKKAAHLDAYLWYQFIAMIWVLSLISAINIGTVAGSAGLWYFGDEADRCNAKDNRTCTALRWCLTKSFGSLCLGSLVSTFIILLQTYLIYVKETLLDDEADDMMITKALKCVGRCVVNCLLAILQCILRFVTYFATIYLVTRGESFCQGAKKCFNLLKRNGLSAMAVDSFTSWFVFLTTQAVALGVAFLSGYYFSHYRHMSDAGAFLAGLIAFIIGNLIFGIFTDIIMSVVDAMYVFAAIDEDSGRASTHKSAEKMKELNAKKRN